MMRIDYNNKILKIGDGKVLTMIRALDEYIITINKMLQEDQPGLIYDENMKPTNYGRYLKDEKKNATDVINWMEKERN